jgi:hypothetical protein
VTASAESTDLRHLAIVASSIARRPVEVAAAAEGHRTSTDGRTIFLEAGADHRARLRLLAAQASLLAAGSLRPDLVRQLRRHRGLAQRYLAVEGQRALLENGAALPPSLRRMVDHELATVVRTADDALDLARRERGLAPAWELGTIDVRRLAREPDHPGAGVAPDGASMPRDLDGSTGLGDLDDDENGTDLGRLLSSPVGGGGGLGRLFARLLRPGRARDGGGAPGVDAPTHLSRAHPGAGRSSVLLPARMAWLDGPDPGRPVTHRYPEWDERRRSYRADWCQVVEQEAAATPGSHRGLVESAALRRALASIGTGRTTCRRRRQGDDIDVDAAVDARIDLIASGRSSDEVYVEHLPRRRDLSVLVLLDVSGSAAEPGVAGRSVHEHQTDAAAALTTALHQLGDRVALYSFSSRGRTDVHVSRVKGFDEPFDGRASRRLDGLRPTAYTRLGAAIRHGTAALETDGGTPRRLLVVLSDGFAYDHGYEGSYGEADARRALVEARRRGIGSVCLSVGADADLAALQRVFGSAAHAALPTADQLPGSIGPLFAAALRSAEAQRRTHQRTLRTRARRRVEERAA